MEDLINKSNFLQDFFITQNMDDIQIIISHNHILAKDSQGNKWKDKEIYYFIFDECLDLDEEGNLLPGLDAAKRFIDKLKIDAADFGVII